LNSSQTIIIQRSIGPCRRALEDAKLTNDKIDEVVSCRGFNEDTKVTGSCEEFLWREPHRGVNPDEVVALGAAVQAGVLAER
jgi:molecular chaperone DnaK